MLTASCLVRLPLSQLRPLILPLLSLLLRLSMVVESRVVLASLHLPHPCLLALPHRPLPLPHRRHTPIRQLQHPHHPLPHPILLIIHHTRPLHHPYSHHYSNPLPMKFVISPHSHPLPTLPTPPIHPLFLPHPPLHWPAAAAAAAVAAVE